MRQSFRHNPKISSYNIAEILKLCEMTTLTYQEIAVLEDVPAKTVLRICAKKSKRLPGRPKKLSEEGITQKVLQVVNFYKVGKKRLDSTKLARLLEFLTEKSKMKLPVRKSQSKKVLPDKFKRSKPQAILKRDYREKVRGGQVKLNRPKKLEIPIEKKRLRRRYLTPVSLVIDFLVEKHKHSKVGIPFTMLTFANNRDINYPHFTVMVKKYISEARYLANQQIAKIDEADKKIEYRQHVINYLAENASLSRENRSISKLEYIERNKLDYTAFMEYFGKYRSIVKDEVLLLFHKFEEERLHKLRQEHAKLEPEEQARQSSVEFLERIARKRLPVRKGVVEFSPSKRENKRLEEIWLQIAEDVSRIGLIDAVAEKWSKEINIPPAFSISDRNKLISIRIETVLSQLGIFEPPVTPMTFAQLHAWVNKTPKPEPELESELKLGPELETELGPEPKTFEPLIDEEKWLEQELLKEQMESRRYLDNISERTARRQAGHIIFSENAEKLTKTQLLELKNLGAIYDSGDWLLLTKEDLDKFTPSSDEIDIYARSLQGWTKSQKPKLLVGIGTSDYTKDWMQKAFNLRIVGDSIALNTLINSFNPDALMIYKSSSSKSLYDAFTQAARITGIPLIIFDRGFSDAILSAEKQGLKWFADAHRRRHSPKKI